MLLLVKWFYFCSFSDPVFDVFWRFIFWAILKNVQNAPRSPFLDDLVIRFCLCFLLFSCYFPCLFWLFCVCVYLGVVYGDLWVLGSVDLEVVL